MRRIVSHCLLALSCCLPIIDSADAAEQAPAPVRAEARLAQLLARPVTLRGTLDGAPFQMDLRLKPDETEALEGSYFLFGQSRKVMLAGEFEQDALMMEESANGKDVSGL